MILFVWASLTRVPDSLSYFSMNGGLPSPATSSNILYIWDIPLLCFPTTHNCSNGSGFSPDLIGCGSDETKSLDWSYCHSSISIPFLSSFISCSVFNSPLCIKSFNCAFFLIHFLNKLPFLGKKYLVSLSGINGELKFHSAFLFVESQIFPNFQ